MKQRFAATCTALAGGTIIREYTSFDFTGWRGRAATGTSYSILQTNSVPVRPGAWSTMRSKPWSVGRAIQNLVAAPGRWWG